MVRKGLIGTRRVGSTTTDRTVARLSSSALARRQVSGMTECSARAAVQRWAGKCGVPFDRSKGYDAATPGAELNEVGRRWRRGLHPRTPRGRAVPGRGDATRLPASGERAGWVIDRVDQPGVGE